MFSTKACSVDVVECSNVFYPGACDVDVVKRSREPHGKQKECIEEFLTMMEVGSVWGVLMVADSVS